ncbi:MAG: glycosyltransferase [Brevefilum sp.]
MRVLYFTERDSPHDRRFLRALSETAHQIYALRQMDCLPEIPPGVIELNWPEGTPDWTYWQGWQAGTAQLKHLLEQVQPDLVHAGPVQGPALVTALTGFHPLVTMSWGSDMLMRADRSPWMRHATRFTLGRTDIFLADCQTVADQVVCFGFDRSRIEIFPWGVDLDHFSPQNGLEAGAALRRSLGWEDQFIIFCNRSWSPIYGVDLLAQAFTRAARQNADLRLLLAGNGPQADLIRHLLMPVGDKVSFPGWLDREDLPGAYCAGDLFVTPSHCDGSSISLLEALACGRPVLASDIPANKEWVVPGEVGRHFKDGDVDSLVSQLLGMAAKTDLPLYGKRGRKLAETRADWGRNFEKCLAAYHQAIT